LATRPFADYFDLQLRLAAVMAERTDIPVREAMGLYTNLARRLGMFDLSGCEWSAYLDGLEVASDRLAYTLEAFDRADLTLVSPGQSVFGCFACDPPDGEGRLQIHFQNREFGRDPGPLSSARIDARMAELRAMFGFVQREYPAALQVKGGSWLYNLEAYRRLFPPQYSASRQPRPEPVRLSGTSSWGQMVDYRGLVRPEAKARFVTELARIDVARPWTIFPLRAQATAAPLKAFFDFYGV
jgi:hypothetical protein